MIHYFKRNIHKKTIIFKKCFQKYDRNFQKKPKKIEKCHQKYLEFQNIDKNENNEDTIIMKKI